MVSITGGVRRLDRKAEAREASFKLSHLSRKSCISESWLAQSRLIGETVRTPETPADLLSMSEVPELPRFAGGETICVKPRR